MSEAWWTTWEKVRHKYPPYHFYGIHLLTARIMSQCLCAAALSSCAHVKELIRTKQGQFTLEEHALHEEHWTLEHILQALQPC